MIDALDAWNKACGQTGHLPHILVRARSEGQLPQVSSHKRPTKQVNAYRAGRISSPVSIPAYDIAESLTEVNVSKVPLPGIWPPHWDGDEGWSLNFGGQEDEAEERTQLQLQQQRQHQQQPQQPQLLLQKEKRTNLLAGCLGGSDDTVWDSLERS